MEIWVSARASWLNEQDHVDFVTFAEVAKANGGDAYMSMMYHAHMDGDVCYITTFDDDDDNYHARMNER